MVAAGREVEVAVVPADAAVLRVEHPVAALGLVGDAEDGSWITGGEGLWAKDPYPAVVLGQQRGMHVGGRATSTGPAVLHPTSPECSHHRNSAYAR